MDRWDMSTLYGDVEGERFLGELKSEKELSGKIASMIESGNHTLGEILPLYEELLDISESLEAYMSALMSVNAGDDRLSAAFAQVEAQQVEVNRIQVAFALFLKEHQEDPVDEKYRFVLGEILDDANRMMTPEMENLAFELNRTGCEAFSRLQQDLSAQAVYNGRTSTMLRGDAFLADRKARKAAFDDELALFKQQEHAFAAALNGVKGTTLTLERMHGWDSPLEHSLAISRLSKKGFDALLGALEESIPLFRRYLARKAEVLGLEKLAFYDLFAPVGDVNMEFTYPEACEFVTSRISAFSPRMGAFMKSAIEKNWIDPFPREGKTGGAYDVAFPRFKQSRVMANFDGCYNGLSTIAHELGHAFHDSVSFEKSHLLRTYPMTLAESASIFSEFVTFRGALEQADEKESFVLIEQFVQNCCQVCLDILCRFYFERELFEKRRKQELSADALCALMVECQKKTYGDLSEYHPWMWAVKGHYYSADFSFYNYPYAFGQLFGLGLYGVYEKDKAGFEDTYVKLLSLSGEMPVAEAAGNVGIDIEDPAFYRQGLSIIAGYIERFLK